ncbi:MAG: hypothetical protein PWR27_175 [Petroclostridium sp.]|jgi:hypothetical protein|uniref:DUF2680 domain-containing protein n=1 Tax=Petroclostridium xylanilyticum TaxID=1792311 RepID=UPI000B97D2CD|nr:DUF2680 domain-containing protein [Petroclostridium xylanilyticum]MBZ4646633.1 hypothetical protein [Clostridia bacterium]MDK2809466.1 hypothetical protein [Petroclostridium sp.]
MKKKITVLITTLLLITAIAVPVALAADEKDSKASDFFNSMFDFHRKWVDKAVEKGDITEDEAKQWNEHFDYMQKFHEENGFGGQCGGVGGPGNGPANQSYRSQFNRGMMGGYGGMMGSYFDNEL